MAGSPRLEIDGESRNPFNFPVREQGDWRDVTDVVSQTETVSVNFRGNSIKSPASIFPALADKTPTVKSSPSNLQPVILKSRANLCSGAVAFG